MARRSVKAAPEAREAKGVVPETKVARSDSKVTFRTPHPGLEVVVKQSERTDLGAGSYSISQPKLAKFENMGSYGELVCDVEVAKVLRQKAKDREARHLPPKYAEVERHVESGT